MISGADDSEKRDRMLRDNPGAEGERDGGKSIKEDKYRALKRKGMPKSRAAAISNAGESASRKGGRKAARKSSKKR